MIGRRQVLTGLSGVGLLSPLTTLADVDKSHDNTELRPSILCVGVSDYEHIQDLPSAVSDASLVAAAFLKLGYRVSLLVNPTQTEFLHELARFGAMAGNTPLTLAYVAAHGGMRHGQTHLFLKDARQSIDGVPETVLLQAMNTKPRQKILFLDSCRESPITGAYDHLPTDQYLAGIHVSYASQPGAPALDGQNGHSPYANALEAALQVPGLDMSELSRMLRFNVMQQTNGLQIPWDRSSLVLPVILNLGP